MAKKHPKSSHKKPTQEEIDKAAAEAEALKNKIPKVNLEDEEIAREEAEEGNEDDSEEDDESSVTPKKPKEDDPDYKKKFSESSRNAQKINAKNKKVNEAIDAEIPKPTDEEMMQEFPDWDIMEDFNKDLAKESVMSRRFRENLKKAREEGQKIEKWNEQVDEFVADPETLTKNPDLEGRLDEFKTFATVESNSSVPFKVLIPAFLHNATPQKKNKGQMFPKGSPGTPDPNPKDNKLTIEEGRKLRQTDQRKWKRYLKAGKIQMEP